MRKIVIQYERSMEIDIRFFSGDSLIQLGGFWNCAGTASIISTLN